MADKPAQDSREYLEMTDKPAQDSRESHRIEFCRLAWVRRRNGVLLDRCQVTDISDSGARILATSLPDRLVIDFTGDGKVTRFCRVVWRDDVAAGVEFLDEAP